MTPINKSKLKAFVLTLACGLALAAVTRIAYLIWRHPTWNPKADIRAERKRLQTYKERCEALDGVTVRLHDATANELYDELCLVPNP